MGIALFESGDATRLVDIEENGRGTNGERRNLVKRGFGEKVIEFLVIPIVAIWTSKRLKTSKGVDKERKKMYRAG